MVDTCIPLFYYETSEHETEAVRRIERLSHRIKTLTAQLPSKYETVSGFLLPEGSKTGPQYRSAMCVLDVVFANEPATPRDAVNALTAWYFHIKKVPFLPSDFATLTAIRDLLWERLQPFVAMGCSLNTPKMHCCAKIAQTLHLFGSSVRVSTDAYERAHKAHKAVYQR